MRSSLHPFLLMFRRQGFIACILFLVSLGALVATEEDIGVTWDEPDYFVAGYQYGQWYSLLATDPGKAFTQESVDQYWDSNHLHPPLSKAVSGIVFDVSGGLVSGTLRARLGNMLLNSLAISFIFLLVARQVSVGAGLASALFLLTLPRYFYHAHLSALDVPVTALMVVTLYAFWSLRNRQHWRYDVLLGVLYGLAVGTKINAAFLIPSLGLWTLLFNRQHFLWRRLVLMGVVGLITWFAIWPWMYFDTFARLKDFIGFMTSNHHQIGQWYLGAFHLPPPWHFPWVMLLAVTPTVLLLLAFMGIYKSLATSDTRAFGAFLLIHLLSPLLILSLGITTVYDNDRLFMPAFPFLAALAGLGIWHLCRWILAKRWASGVAAPARAVVAGVLTLAVMAPYLLYADKVYPHLLSYYSAAVGGLPGAKKMGLEATYWSDTYKEVVPYLNENAKPGDIVWVQEWSQQVLFTYQFTGLLRSDIKLASHYEIPDFYRPWDHTTVVADHQQSQFVVYQQRESFLGPEGLKNPIQDWLSSRQPALEIKRDGVVLLSVYRNLVNAP